MEVTEMPMMDFGIAQNENSSSCWRAGSTSKIGVPGFSIHYNLKQLRFFLSEESNILF